MDFIYYCCGANRNDPIIRKPSYKQYLHCTMCGECVHKNKTFRKYIFLKLTFCSKHCFDYWFTHVRSPKNKRKRYIN